MGDKARRIFRGAERALADADHLLNMLERFRRSSPGASLPNLFLQAATNEARDWGQSLPDSSEVLEMNRLEDLANYEELLRYATPLAGREDEVGAQATMNAALCCWLLRRPETRDWRQKIFMHPRIPDEAASMLVQIIDCPIDERLYERLSALAKQAGPGFQQQLDESMEIPLELARAGELIETEPEVAFGIVEPHMGSTDPKVERWANLVGGMILIRLNRKTEARAIAERLVTRPSKPAQGAGHLLRGLVRLDDGDIDRALPDLKQAEVMGTRAVQVLATQLLENPASIHDLWVS